MPNRTIPEGMSSARWDGSCEQDAALDDGAADSPQWSAGSNNATHSTWWVIGNQVRPPERQRDHLRSDAFVSQKPHLTCNDVVLDPCGRRRGVADLCESKRAQSEPSRRQLPTRAPNRGCSAAATHSRSLSIRPSTRHRIWNPIRTAGRSVLTDFHGPREVRATSPRRPSHAPPRSSTSQPLDGSAVPEEDLAVGDLPHRGAPGQETEQLTVRHHDVRHRRVEVGKGSQRPAHDLSSALHATMGERDSRGPSGPGDRASVVRPLEEAEVPFPKTFVDKLAGSQTGRHHLAPFDRPGEVARGHAHRVCGRQT